MLYELARWLQQLESLFGLFNYQTFRAILAALTALFLSLWLGPAMIRKLAQFALPADPQGRSADPFLQGRYADHGWLADPADRHPVGADGPTCATATWLVLAVMLCFGAIGWYDDWIKIVRRDPNGLKSRWLPLQSIRPGRGLFLFHTADAGSADLLHPDVRRWRCRWPASASWPSPTSDRRLLQCGEPDRRPGWAGDHADRAGGLRAGRVRLRLGQRSVRQLPADPADPGAGELVIICAAIAGAGLGFLWFNTYPAMVFMATSALARARAGHHRGDHPPGAGAGDMGGVFVIETLSVMIQVASSADRQARVPVWRRSTHHFELKGWAFAARDRALLDNLRRARADRPGPR